MKILILALTAVVAASAANCPNIWPMPQQCTSGNTVLTLNPSTFQFLLSISCPDLQAAFSRYMRLIFSHQHLHKEPKQNSASPVIELPSLVINVSNINLPLQYGVDESYVLYIETDGTHGMLHADTIYGIYRGLETFSQMVRFDFATHTYQLGAAPWGIQDWPRFSHRGILFDSSRHFEPIHSIITLLDAMAYSKMNVLHWHAVDSQSFPLEVKSFPNLWNGAYSDDEKYTQDDMAEVVEAARLRGIRVMIEFDVPGHAASWCVGYPSICPSTTCNQPLNPATPDTFNLIDAMFGEMTGRTQGQGIFPDNFFHLGGDEVDYSCWDKSSQITAWQKKMNLNDEGTYMFFVQQAHNIVTKQGRSSVHWEEVFNHFGTKLDNNTIIHIWLDKATLQRVVAAGYRAILSDNDVWYLDHLSLTWEDFYNNEPLTGITDPAQQRLVLGGEVCMWGETVDTSDLQQTVWPRAAAAAERLWSAQSVTDTKAALPRLEAFRCLLNRRGIAAAPTNNKQARDAPPEPGGCYVQ